jgi:hypothetical protein
MPTVRLSAMRTFTGAAVAVVAVGAAVRLAGGGTEARASGDAEYAVVGADRPQALPPGGPQRAVVAFYESVIHGRYAQAHALSLEPRWSAARGGTLRADGLQGGGAFVAALDDEIGTEGMRVGVARFAVGRTRPAAQDAPERVALAELPAGARVGNVVSIAVSGRLVGMCEISRISHRAVAAQVDGRWRVLLPGRRRPNAPHFERWFL